MMTDHEGRTIMLDGASFCEKCGGKLDPEDDICPSCGFRASGLEQDYRKKEDKEKLKEFLAEDTETPVLEEAEKRNPAFYIAVIAVVLVLVAVMVIGIQYQKRRNRPNYNVNNVATDYPDCSQQVYGKWRIISGERGDLSTMEFKRDNTIVLSDPKLKRTSLGEFSFPSKNVIEVTMNGADTKSFYIQVQGNDMRFAAQHGSDLLAFRKVTAPPLIKPSAGATVSPSPAVSESPAEVIPGKKPEGSESLVGDWRVIKAEAKGISPRLCKRWETTRVRITKSSKGKLIWQNINQLTGAPFETPAEAGKVTTYLEIKKTEKNVQCDGDIVGIIESGPRKGQTAAKLPVRTLMEPDGRNITIQLLWGQDGLITLYAEKQ